MKKKWIVIAVVCCALAAFLIGCESRPTSPVGSTPTVATETEPAPTGTEPEQPTVPVATDPTKPQPTNPAPTDAPKPTEPAPTEVLEPDPTQPKPTEPTTTQPKPTEPVPVVHTHSYGAWVVQRAATLLEPGKQSRSCTCGAMEEQEIPALRYGPCTTDEAGARLLSDMVIYYINQFRLEQGDIAATKLPRLTLVAEYRSKQIVTNFAHDTTDIRAVYTLFEYGEKNPDGKYNPETGKIEYNGEYYFMPSGESEAIAQDWSYATIDTTAREIALHYKGSADHWQYVGSSEYPYIAVGAAYSEYTWFTCIKVIDTAKYE